MTAIPFRNLLSISADAKTVKGVKLGYLTGILYLAPETLSGFNVCPMAGIAGCAAACLNSAGRGAFTSVQRARVAKTRLWLADRRAFVDMLARNIRRLIKRARRLGLIPLVRLNGTSDIRWENERGSDGRTLMEMFGDVIFYDYTKIPNRRVPANYDLTFSYSGIAEFQPYVQRALQNPAIKRLAVVFDRAPSQYLGRAVVDGDESDVRPGDPTGVVVALKPKGRARRDESGFVIRIQPI